MTNHPADAPTASWRCGAETEPFLLAGDLEVPAETCTLPASHLGWHRADSGNQWRNEGAPA